MTTRKNNIRLYHIKWSAIDCVVLRIQNADETVAAETTRRIRRIRHVRSPQIESAGLKSVRRNTWCTYRSQRTFLDLNKSSRILTRFVQTNAGHARPTPHSCKTSVGSWIPTTENRRVASSPRTPDIATWSLRKTRIVARRTRSHGVTLRNPSIAPPARSQRGCSTIGNVLAVSHFRVATGGNKQKSYYRQKMFHSKPYLSRL
jgi:hypothetical protein